MYININYNNIILIFQYSNLLLTHQTSAMNLRERIVMAISSVDNKLCLDGDNNGGDYDGQYMREERRGEERRGEERRGEERRGMRRDEEI